MRLFAKATGNYAKNIIFPLRKWAWEELLKLDIVPTSMHTRANEYNRWTLKLFTHVKTIPILLAMWRNLTIYKHIHQMTKESRQTDETRHYTHAHVGAKGFKLTSRWIMTMYAFACECTCTRGPWDADNTTLYIHMRMTNGLNLWLADDWGPGIRLASLVTLKSLEIEIYLVFYGHCIQLFVWGFFVWNTCRWID